MRWWKRKKKLQPPVEAAFRKIANVAFPAAEDQISREAAEVALLLKGRVSQAHAREILVHAKGRILIALHSASDDEEAVRRCVDSILTRWPKELDQATAKEVAAFAYRRLVDSHQARPNTTTTWTEMTKDEALVVARITAYRLARHQGRTDPDSLRTYDFDPELFIMGYITHFLTSLTHNLEGQPKKINTRHDAIQVSLGGCPRIRFLAKYGF